VLASISVLGVVGLGYLCGAAVMFYQWPSSDFLDKCFGGTRAWLERGRSTLVVRAASPTDVEQQEGVSVDKAQKTCDGFTLYTVTDATRATLIDMRGNEVHRWEMSFKQAWPQATHVANPLSDSQIHWFSCRLYANGDLLAIYHADGDTPYGYGLVKLDKDSKLLWTYGENVHHDVAVDEDGLIYTLTQEIQTQPPTGIDRSLSFPLLADSLVVLSPQGQELERIPLLEAFRDSPYALMLTSSTKQSILLDDNTPPPTVSAPGSASASNLSRRRRDLLHANSVRVLPRALAAKFPLFKPGQILISLRNLDALVVVDRHNRSVVWACSGIWRAQHDAECLENGRLLLYDNAGAYNKRTRILEYDPLTQAISWSYTDENSRPFYAVMRGMKQRLPNDNIFIVDPDHQHLLEVTREKELVWECYFASSSAPPGQGPTSRVITSARRYRPEELTFLKGGTRARP
jgi:hypothetical protein